MDFDDMIQAGKDNYKKDAPSVRVNAPVSLWAVGGVEKKHLLNVNQEIELTWADGMVGVLAVFKDKRAAQKYAGKRFQIFEFTVAGKSN